MRLWLASRRPSIVIGGLVVSVVGVVFLGAKTVPTPSFLQGFLISVPLSVYLPLIAVVATTFGLADTPVEIEETAVRRVALYDAAAVVSIAAVVALSCGGVAIVSQAGAPLQGARNLVGYLGLAVLALATFGPQAATFAPAGFAVAASTFGWSSARTVRWWAWPLAPEDDVRAAMLAVATVALGIVALGSRGRRPM